MAARTRSLVLCFIGDGNLYGASASAAAHGGAYWRPLLSGKAFALHVATDVPADLAASLCKLGTSAQEHRDGYDAAQDAAPYTAHEPFWTEEATEDDGEPCHACECEADGCADTPAGETCRVRHTCGREGRTDP